MILFSVQSSVCVFVLVTLVFLHISEFLASHSVIFTVFFRDVTSKAMENNVFVLICLPTTRPFTNYPSPVVLLLSTEKKAGGGRHLKHFFPFSPSEISSSTLEIVQRADSRVLAVKKKKKDRQRLLSVSLSAVKQNRHMSAVLHTRTHRFSGGENPPTHACPRVSAQFTPQFRVLI